MHVLIPLELYNNQDLTELEIRLLSILYNMGNYMPTLYPSNQYLADLLYTSKRTVSRSINNLNKLGYIGLEITKRNSRILYINQKTKRLYAEIKPKLDRPKMDNPLNDILDT